MATVIYESRSEVNEIERKKRDPHLAKKRNYELFRLAGAAAAISSVINSDLYPNYISAEAWELLHRLDHLRDKMGKLGRGEDHEQRWPE